MPPASLPMLESGASRELVSKKMFLPEPLLVLRLLSPHAIPFLLLFHADRLVLSSQGMVVGKEATSLSFKIPCKSAFASREGNLRRSSLLSSIFSSLILSGKKKRRKRKRRQKRVKKKKRRQTRSSVGSYTPFAIQTPSICELLGSIRPGTSLQLFLGRQSC